MTPRERIFVQIASYRDPECQWTVKDLFEKARHPERIFVGICSQTIPEQDANFYDVETRPEQVRVVHFHARDTKGVGWARQQTQELWREEEYSLQIDSHMRFVRDWDTKVLEMLALCSSPKSVLTVYPAPYTPPNQLEPRKCYFAQTITKVQYDGLPAFSARPIPPGVPGDRPFPTASLAGGFLFGPAQMIRDVPYDPEIYFNGEELNLAIRLWTHGYDLFSPNEEVAYHYYKRSERRRPWQDFKKSVALQRITMRRMRQLCQPENVAAGEEVDLGVYGLGPARSLRDYEVFSGINFSGRTLAAYAKSYPFVHSSEVVESVIGATEVKLSPHAHLFIVDDEGFLYTQSKGELTHLNPTATLIWCALEEGNTIAAIKEQFFRDGLEKHYSAEVELTNFIAHLQGLGALAGTETILGEAIDKENEPSPDDFDPQDYRSAAQISEEYTLLGHSFRITYADNDLKDCVHCLLRGWSAEAAARDPIELLICSDPDAGYRGVFKDQVAFGTFEQDELAGAVQQWMQNQILETWDPPAWLSGGLLSRDGCGVMIVNNGADDLLLWKLIARGFTYFSATVAPLSRASLRARPVPLGLRIRGADVPFLSSEPGTLPPSAAFRDHKDQPMRLILPPPDRCAGDNHEVEIQKVIFVDRESSAPDLVTHLGAGEGLRRLIETAMVSPKLLSLPEVTRLVAKFEATPYYAIRLNDLDEAVEAIDALAVL